MPHLLWEGVLLLLVVVLAVVVPLVSDGGALRMVFTQLGALGLVASGLALSFRTATPNLAVGAFAALAGAIETVLAAHAHWPALAAMAVGVVVVTVVGAVIGVLVAALSVPAWAVTAGAGVIGTAATIGVTSGNMVVLPGGPGLPDAVWTVLFLLVTIGGAFLWRLPAVRTALSASRTSGDPARWAGFRAGLGAIAGITVSSLLAGLGGAASTSVLRGASPAVNDSLLWAALAAVLLGGVSVFGRRAAIAGTLLGVLIMVFVQTLLALLGLSAMWTSAAAGVLIIAGLGVSRGLESLGGRLPGGATRTGSPARTT